MLNEKAFYECHLGEDSDPLLHGKYTSVIHHFLCDLHRSQERAHSRDLGIEQCDIFTRETKNEIRKHLAIRKRDYELVK